MEIIDPKDVPRSGGRNPIYPYEEISAALAQANGVVLDPAEYDTTATNMANTFRGYVMRHRLPWRVTMRNDRVYVLPGEGDTHGNQ